MSTYTNDENIRFLNDKNISQTLGDDTARQINTIPSLDLLNEVNNALTAYDNKLCAYIDGLNEEYQFDETSPYLSVITKIQQVKGQLSGIESIELLSSHVKNLKEFVEDTIDSLDVAVLSETNKFVRTLSEVDGKIQATFSNVISSDLDGQLQQTQIENLTDDLESCYKKSGGLINGDAYVNGVLSAANNAVVDGNATVRGNLVQGRGTSWTGDAMHSVVLGISATTNKDDVFLWNGKQNEAYTDHGRGTFSINAVSGVNGVFVGNESIGKFVGDSCGTTLDNSKTYTNDVSAALSTDYVKKIANAKTEAIDTSVNQLTIPYINSVSTTLSTDYVEKIESAINSAAADATEKVNALDATLHEVGTLVSANLDFDYNETTRLITLNIQDYGGNNHTFSIDSARFIKGRIVDHVNIVEIDGQQVLRIWWTVEEGGTGVYSDVPLTTLAQVYNAGKGIAITLGENGYIVSVNDTIVNKTFLNEKVAEINDDIDAVNDKANTNTAKITSLSEISANHVGRIQALESGLATANTNIQENAEDIETANTNIASLQTYANSLSVPNGQIQTLSNAILAVDDYAHDKLSGRIEVDEGKINAVSSHTERLQSYVDQLSNAGGDIQVLSNAILAVDDYAHDKLSGRIEVDEGKIDAISAHAERLQEYANILSNDGGTINTLSNDIIQLSTNIIASDSFIGEIKVNYNNLTAGTDQAWVSQYGNNLSGIIKHFTLAPLGYVKQNTVIKVTYTNVPNSADRTKFAILKYTTDDGITFTDNDYIIIHGDFDQIKLEDIQPINVHYVNAVKRHELFELSNAVVKLSTDLSGDIDKLSTDLSNDLSVEINARIANDAVLSTAIDNKIWIYDSTTAGSTPVSTNLSVVKMSKDDFEDEIIANPTLNGNTLYIVDSDYIEAYDEEIKNVASSDVATNAATVGQVNAKAVEISNELSTNWLRCTSANIRINDAGSYANILQGPNNVGGYRIVPSSDGKYNAVLSNGSTVYQLNNIRKYTNLTAFTDYALDDSSNNGIVRKSTAKQMLSAEMLKIQYPVGSVYCQIAYPAPPVNIPDPPTVCPVSADGTAWNGPIADGTITIEGTALNKYCWIRLM